MNYLIKPIGIIHSCFKEKFAIPRQPGLVPAARAELELFPPYGSPESLRGLSDFSHLWIIFIFHGNSNNGWKATVRPPRLGGNQRMGVFASRSGFRPNNIGMSAVALERICITGKIGRLYLKGGDFLDQTPVLDVKPYLPYADSIPKATANFASTAPSGGFSVLFSPPAEAVCRNIEQDIPLFRQLIIQILQQDPRPAYYKDRAAPKIHGFRIYDFNIQWKNEKKEMIVTDITPAVD